MTSTSRRLVKVSPGGLIRYPGERAKRVHHYEIRPASNPTDAMPGSEEKIRVLMERASRREELRHPADRGLELGNHRLDPAKLARLWDRGPGSGHAGRKKGSAERDGVQICETSSLAAATMVDKKYLRTVTGFGW